MQLKDVSASDFDDVLSEMLLLGDVVDRQAEFQDLVGELFAEIALLEDAVEGREHVRISVLSYYVGELGGVYVGGVAEDDIARVGGVNPTATPRRSSRASRWRS